jgi:hypothetical protein
MALMPDPPTPTTWIRRGVERSRGSPVMAVKLEGPCETLFMVSLRRLRSTAGCSLALPTPARNLPSADR